MTGARGRRGWAIPAVVFGGLAVVALVVWRSRPETGSLTVRVPQLSVEALAGQRVFEAHCARCHGPHGAGSATGPPLVHRVYQTAHHADVAFDLAVRGGVRAHHWRFGDMPPVPAVTGTEVIQITRFVRELQRANGIE